MKPLTLAALAVGPTALLLLAMGRAVRLGKHVEAVGWLAVLILWLTVLGASIAVDRGLLQI